MFSKIHSSFNDIVNDFKYGQTLKCVHKANNGIKVETGADVLADDVLLAYTKLNVDHSFGKFETKVKTNNSGDVKFETKKLLPGMNVIVSANEKPQYKAEVQYAKDCFNVCASFTQCKGAGAINANGVAAVAGAHVGASVDFDVSASQVGAVKTAAAMKLGAKGKAGVAYNMNMAKSTSCMSVGYVHAMCSRMNVAARACYNITTAKPCLSLGTSLKLNADTTYKMRCNDSGDVAVSLTQTLASPAMKCELTGASNVFNAGAGAKYGFGFTFGDF